MASDDGCVGSFEFGVCLASFGVAACLGGGVGNWLGSIFLLLCRNDYECLGVVFVEALCLLKLKLCGVFLVRSVCVQPLLVLFCNDLYVVQYFNFGLAVLVQELDDFSSWFDNRVPRLL